jgi:hypothetical protein
MESYDGFMPIQPEEHVYSAVYVGVSMKMTQNMWNFSHPWRIMLVAREIESMARTRRLGQNALMSAEWDMFMSADDLARFRENLLQQVSEWSS